MTFTKEQLQHIIETDHVQCGDASALARMALAGMEAEPVYFINRVKHSDAYGDDVELRTYCYELDALKSKDDFGGEVVPDYAAPPAPVAQEDIALQNYRAAMEGICHIRRTLEETFGGLHGTHCEPDILVECKEICDAICEAYRNAPVAQPVQVLDDYFASLVSSARSRADIQSAMTLASASTSHMTAMR